MLHTKQAMPCLIFSPSNYLTPKKFCPHKVFTQFLSMCSGLIFQVRKISKKLVNIPVVSCVVLFVISSQWQQKKVIFFTFLTLFSGRCPGLWLSIRQIQWVFQAQTSQWSNIPASYNEPGPCGDLGPTSELFFSAKSMWTLEYGSPRLDEQI